MKDKKRKSLLAQLLKKSKAKENNAEQEKQEELTKLSRYVHKYIDRDDDFLVVLGQAVNKKAEYLIELEPDELEMIFDTYPFREFEGFFANFEEIYDFDKSKAYVKVNFREITPEQRFFMGERAIPGFKLNLRYSDEKLAEKVFVQLTKQALEMEANTKEEDKWNIPELSMD